MALLEIEGLRYTAGGIEVLAGVDLMLEAGRIHALLGTNGAGKSTLARLVMGCGGYQPFAGTIRFQGRSLAGVPMHERARRGITVAWQEPPRFEGITLGDYLALGPGGSEPESLLLRVGLPPERYLHRPLDKTLSGGERKRAELAAVLAFRPRLAILDEPLSGIDLLSLPELLPLLNSLKEQGAGVLLITHLEAVARAADRASLLCAGRITDSGDPAAMARRYRERGCALCDATTCRDD
jgi:Fe-S cluster assembly ATP-binding protein